MQYEIMRTVMGGRELFAPLKDPKKILDIGTGTGTWPIAIGTALTSSLAHLPPLSLLSLLLPSLSPPSTQMKRARWTWS